MPVVNRLIFLVIYSYCRSAFPIMVPFTYGYIQVGFPSSLTQSAKSTVIHSLINLDGLLSYFAMKHRVSEERVIIWMIQNEIR